MVAAWLYLDGSVVPASGKAYIAGVAALDAAAEDVFPVCVYGPCEVLLANGGPA